MDTRPIGIFDSGLGGLTVVKQISKMLPDESIVYFGDTGRVPYGTKSKETITKYAKQDINFLNTFNVKMIVAACGTVSSVLTGVNSFSDVPYVRVIDSAAKCAAKSTKNKVVGLLGTAATVNSSTLKNLILKQDSNIKVVQNICSLFVPLVESGWFKSDDIVVRETAKRYLAPLIEAGCDTIVLGCTHYPVLAQVIGEIVGENVKLINMGKTVAEYIKNYLTENDMLSDKKHENHFYVSDTPTSFEKTAEYLLQSNVEFDVKRVDIERY